jgi:dihydroorotase
MMIHGGRIIDPASGRDEKTDILIENGQIKEIGSDLSSSIKNPESSIQAEGKWVLPGLVDMHVHLREPGREDEETVESGGKAAVAGGFTSLCCMANTDPPIDDQGTVRFVLEQAEGAGLARIFPIGAVTKGLEGKELSEIGDLISAGCVAVSDDGQPVMNAEIMRRALEYTKPFNIPVISHAEDKHLSKGGSMNEGIISTTLGIRGIPRIAEDVMVARNICLAEFTEGRLHIAHLSTRGSVQLIREAKKRGVSITTEVTPHHLLLTDENVKTFETHFKMNPPLRTQKDVDALREGLSDGTIDAIASDHAPHALFEKEVEFEAAPFGIIGLETTLGLVLTELVDKKILSLSDAVAKLTCNPAKIMRLDGGELKAGGPADITIVDPEKEWTVEPTQFHSKSRNTPFSEWKMKGGVFATIVGGRVLYQEGKFV